MYNEGGGNMIESASSIGIGFLTNTIFDLAKYAGQYFASRIKDKDLQELVEQKILESIPDNLTLLFQSSTFITYFNTPQFLDVINAYIQHKIICDYTYENSNIQKYSKKPGLSPLLMS